MFDFIRRRMSVRLSLSLLSLVVPSLVIVAVPLILRETKVVENLVLKEANTAAITGASIYGRVLDEAVDSGALTLEEILAPAYEEIKFTGPDGQPIKVEDARYHTRVGDYTDAHGLGPIQDAIMDAGGFLFASGMDRRGYVPTPHAKYAMPPKGTATDEFKAWDRKFSRGKRMYDGAEQIAAAGFKGNPKARTLTQEYPRDTGDMAWDVAAPIFVKGKHFGGFRVGVPQDRITQQYRDLTFGLTALFSLLTLAFVGFTFLMTWRHIKPLTLLAERVNKLSICADVGELSMRILSDDPSEVGEMTRSVNRLRGSLYAAISRIDNASGNSES